MKPVLLHGPALDSSRKKLGEMKSKFGPNNIVVFEKGADIKDILSALQTVSMFDEDRLFVIENPPEALLSDSLLITTYSPLVLWFDHEIKKLPQGVEILFFPEAKEYSIFPLLDLLAAGKKEAFIEAKKRTNDTQYIITMIFYLLRSLTVPPKNAPPFVKNKLAKQRSRFSEEDLKNLYRFVIETDYKIKSGFMESDQAEFLILNKFIAIESGIL